MNEVAQRIEQIVFEMEILMNFTFLALHNVFVVIDTDTALFFGRLTI